MINRLIKTKRGDVKRSEKVGANSPPSTANNSILSLKNTNEDEKKIVVKASELNTQGFCEYKIFLQRVLGQKELKKHEKTILGAKTHDEIDENFFEEAEEVSLEDFVKRGGTIRFERHQNLFSNKHLLIGRPDEIHLDPKKGLTIFDDKQNDFPYIGVKQQLWGYGLLSEENFVERFRMKIPIFVAVRNEFTGEIGWVGEFTAPEKEHCISTIKRVRAIICGEFEPVPTKKAFKCKYCSLDCDRRLAPFEERASK